jgi:hypothetical protein
MQAVSVYVVALLLVALLAWSAVNEDISCVLVGGEPVSERGSERVSEGVSVAGFYAARGGVYMRRGRPVRVLPDFFSLISERVSDAVSERVSGVVVVSQDRHRWLVQQQWRSGSGSGAAAVRRRELFRHTPRHAQQFLFSPPPGDWRRVRSGGVEEWEEASDLAVKQCHGSLVSAVCVVQCSAVSECSAECAVSAVQCV